MNLNRHIEYGKYLIKHKKFVFEAGYNVAGVSVWRLLIHDLSKLLPSEWFPYAECFYDEDGGKQYVPSTRFDVAWLKHIHRNKHHWQYWILRMDSGVTIPQKMPQKYVREMVADWMGAGRAITGVWAVAEWFEKNRHNMQLHPTTENEVDSIISIVKHYKGKPPLYKDRT